MRDAIRAAVERRLEWRDPGAPVSASRRRRAAIATAFAYLYLVGPSLALIGLLLPASGRDDRAIAFVSLSALAGFVIILIAFDRLHEWVFHAFATTGAVLIGLVIYFGSTQLPVLALYLAWVPLYVAYLFPFRAAVAQAVIAGVAFGVAQELRDGGLGGEWGVMIVPMVLAPAALVVFLRGQEQRLVEALEHSRDELRQSQKLEAVGRLAGGIAHDFNNLLTAISGHAEFARSSVPAGSSAAADLDAAIDAAARASALTRQLLAVSRSQVLQPQVVDLNEHLLGLAAMLRSLIGEHIELATSLAQEVGRVRVDASQLDQVVLNLVVNARDAMPGGGTLRIETRVVELGEDDAEPERLAPGRYASLTVSDTGTGISAEVLPYLFDPFVTTKGLGEGTGLGLATVQGIVSQSGGHVDVVRSTFEGTTFRVLLPEAVEDAVPGQADEAPEAPGGAERILLVEDDERVRDLARRMLEDAGYLVHAAPHARQALELLESGELEVDLLLSDVVMPQMSGTELASRFNGLRPGVPIVFMSGYIDNPVSGQGVLELGAGFVPKPFTAGSLVDTVRTALDEHAKAPAKR
jgi:signal transduction histidine kinase/ActR/RegA family two-component response regulator